MMREQYKITWIAKADTMRHKRDLWTFVERSLWIKKIKVKVFCEDDVDVSRLREIYTKIFYSVLTG